MILFWALLIIVLSNEEAKQIASKLESTSLERVPSPDVDQDAVSSEDRGLWSETSTDTAHSSQGNVALDSTLPESEVSEKDVQTQNEVVSSKNLMNPDTKLSVTYIVQKVSELSLNKFMDTRDWSTVSIIGALCFYLTLILVLCICSTISCSLCCDRRRRVKQIRRERLLDEIAEEL